MFRTLFYLRNYTLVPFVTYYSCSSGSISIKNTFGVSNVTVYSRLLSKLPTYSNLNWINFTPSLKNTYNPSKNICVFEGYMCLGCPPSSITNIVGNTPIDTVYNIHSMYTISLWHLYFQNNINDNFQIEFENNTIVYYNNVFSNYLK